MAKGKSQQQGPLRRAESENNPAASSSSKSLLRWPLAKYAYLLNAEKIPVEESNGGNKWQERVSQHNQPDMWIQITKVS